MAAAALVSALSVLGCRPGATPALPSDSKAEPSSEPEVEPAAEGGRPAQPDTSEDQRTQRLIEQRLAVVSELRGLETRERVRGEELSASEMVEHVRRSIETEVPEDVIKATNAFLYLAGVVDASFDYEQSLLQVMGTDLAGFYDPDRKTMYLRKGLGTVERGATLAHELVHALQDQHYDLAVLDTWEPDASDRRSALHALAEGDATSAMLDGMVVGTARSALDLPEQALTMQVGALASGSAVDDVVLRAVVSPYVDGLRFVHALRREGSWSRVDQAWRAPPISTEQLLHPEKYLAGEAPQKVALPEPPPDSEMRRIYQDVEGEQALRILFEEWFPPRDAALFAADWGGDRMSVFARGEQQAFAWVIRYDTEAAAARAMKGMLGWQAGGRGDPPKTQRGTLALPYCGEDPARGPLAMARRSRDIAVVGGPSKVAAGCLLARRWLFRLLGKGN